MNREPRPPPTPDRRYDFLNDNLNALAQANLSRELIDPRNLSTPGRAVLGLCSNDYLGLATDKRVIAGAQQAAARWGAGGISSRLIAGEIPLYGALEEALADFLQTDAALVFSTGYHANLGLMGVIPGRNGHTFSDALNHASIIDGCRLGRSRVTIFPHNDSEFLAKALLASPPGPSLIVTEGLFSMDGDACRLPELKASALAHGALLAVDDAHGIGAMGPGGRGSVWHPEAAARPDILMGTFGKAFGASGAFVAGPRIVRESLINLARSFIFTTAPCPAAMGAALAALNIIRAGEGHLEILADHSRWVREGLLSQGADLGPGTAHIIPIMVGDASRALEFSRLLLEDGIYVRAIRPPTVPPGTCRLRLTLSAALSRSDLDRAVEVIGRWGRNLGVFGSHTQVESDGGIG